MRAAQATTSPIMHEVAAAMSAAQAATSPIIEEILAAKWAPQETVGGNVFVGLEARANETFVDDEYLIENTELRSANARLSSRLSELTDRLTALEEKIDATSPTVVVLRELSREDAKAEIIDLFSQGNVLDYEDVVTQLRIDLELAVELCDELIEEGEIGPVGDID